MEDFNSSGNSKKAFEDIFSDYEQKAPKYQKKISDEEYYKNASTPPVNPKFSSARQYEDFNTGRNDTDSKNYIPGDDEDKLTPPFVEGDAPAVAPKVRRNTYSANQPQRNKQATVRKNTGSGNKNRKPRKKKVRKVKRFIVSLILIVVILAAAFFGYAYMCAEKLNHIDDKGHDNPYVSTSELNSNNKVKNILLIGVDKEENDSSRSDTNMLISIDGVNKKIKMLSFMRDLWVEIPDNGNAKLNAACAYGGPELTVYTIEKNFGVKIDGFVMVDFNIFVSLIDCLGGVDVEVTEMESEFMKNEQGFLDIPAGESVHLNGKEALLYSRIRYLDSDFMRTKRQRKVITALINKMKSPNVLGFLKSSSDVFPQITTNIPSLELTSLGVNALYACLNYDIVQTAVPFDDKWYYDTIDWQSVICADMDEQKQMVNEYLYDYSEEKFETTTQSE